MHQPDPCPQPPARPLGITNTQFLHNLACNFPTTHSNLETKTFIFRRFQRRPRTCFEELHATCREAPQRYLQDRQEDANAVVERTPPTACMHSSAQSADHLDKNRRKTAVVTEVVCTLGRLSMRTILINAMHQPDPCPRTSARPLDPLGTTNTQFLHNLARNFPTTHSNLETRTLIFCRFQGAPRDSLQGIACDIQGGTSAVSAGSTGGRQRGRGRSSTAACAQNADHLDKNRRKTAVVTEVVCTLGRLSTWTILTHTQHRLPTPPQRPTARTRIGYEHADRLLSYPQANNLSAWWQPIHIAATNPRNGSASASRRASAGNIKTAWQSRMGQATRRSGHHINTRGFFSTPRGSYHSSPTASRIIPHNSFKH